MKLVINTVKGDSQDIEISLCDNNNIIDSSCFNAHRRQAEMLLPAIEKLLIKNNKSPEDLTKIEVENRGGSFTSLRVGVITANALAYALGIPVSSVSGKGDTIEEESILMVKPMYDSEPNIG